MTIRADAETVAAYRAAAWWGEETAASRIASHAARDPDGIAYTTGSQELTWTEYDQRSTDLAATLAGTGLAPGDRVAVLLPDGPMVHVCFVAAEKAGLVVVGLGHRAGDREIRHLVALTGARALVTPPQHRDRSAAELLDALRAGDAGDAGAASTLEHLSLIHI